MKSLLFIVVLCSLYAEPTRTPAQERRSQDLEHKVLTAEDFIDRTAKPLNDSDTAIFLIQINKKLPPYRVLVTPDLTAHNSGHGDPGLDHVGRIDISPQNSPAKHQVIEVNAIAWSNMLVRFFKAEDINFDGYLDLAILYEYGAKWGRYQYWLFDKTSGRFVTNSLTRRLGRLSYNSIDLDPKTREIKLGSYRGVCPQSRTYRILKSTLLLTEVEERECEMDGSKVRIKRRIKGKLRLVKTEFEKSEN